MQPSFSQKTLAFSVHLFTASGMVAGFLAILATTEGDFRAAMLWLLIAFFIDGVDGTLARRFKVKEVLPHYDGKTIDYVIDFANYAIIPAFVMYEAGIVPASVNLLTAAIVLLISAIYYGKSGMVSDDFYFIGFPVLWNIVAFYLIFVVSLSLWWNFAWILFFGVLHFVPIKFLYPSRTLQFRWLNLIMSALFIISNGMILWIFPDENQLFNTIALLCAIYFCGMAVYNTYFEKKN